MSIVLIVLGMLCILLGLLGSVLPVLPGPVLSFLGLLLLERSAPIDFPTQLLIVLAIATVFTVVSDYLFPILGAKKGGSTKRGTRGSIVGVIAGFFILPPWGLLILPLAGAFVGEYLAKKNFKTASRAAYSVFMGGLGSTLVKLIVAGVIMRYAVKALILLI